VWCDQHNQDGFGGQNLDVPAAGICLFEKEPQCSLQHLLVESTGALQQQATQNNAKSDDDAAAQPRAQTNSAPGTKPPMPQQQQTRPNPNGMAATPKESHSALCLSFPV
jgi:hypothetical protein